VYLDDSFLFDNLLYDNFFRNLNNFREEDELLEFGEEFLDELNLQSQGWVGVL
jgi:hypothetical protein